MYNKNLADNADSGAGLVWFSMGKIFHLSDAENYFKLFFFLKNRVTDLPEIVQTKIDQLLELVTQGRGFWSRGISEKVFTKVKLLLFFFSKHSVLQTETMEKINIRKTTKLI